nr:MAG TPA: hypothetical protein [Caudoviricetes sp.]
MSYYVVANCFFVFVPWELVLPVGLFLFIDFLLLHSYSGYCKLFFCIRPMGIGPSCGTFSFY